MKKILFVINTLGHAGAEVALIELLNRMDPEKYEVSLYVLMGQGEMRGRLPRHVRLLNHTYSDESVLSKEGSRNLRRTVFSAFFRNGNITGKTYYLIRNFLKMKKNGKIQMDKLLWRILAEGAERFEETYDLAVAYLEGGSTYYVADYVKAKKKAAFIHIDYTSSGYTRYMDQGCYRKIDRIFAVSEEARKHFLQFYPEQKEKTKIFHNIIDQEKIRKNADKPGGFKDKYTGIRLLTVGRLTYQKAYDIAVEAMKIIKDAGFPARWYILGEGGERDALEKRIAELGLKDDFILCGAVKNPFPYFVQADIYVHATRFEGKSIAIQEAQTLGCAIIASDCNGNREQIIHEEDGILCRLDPEILAENIMALIKDTKKREKLAAAAGQKVIVHEEEIQLLLELLDQKGKR